MRANKHAHATNECRRLKPGEAANSPAHRPPNRLLDTHIQSSQTQFPPYFEANVGQVDQRSVPIRCGSSNRATNQRSKGARARPVHTGEAADKTFLGATSAPVPQRGIRTSDVAELLIDLHKGSLKRGFSFYYLVKGAL